MVAGDQNEQINAQFSQHMKGFYRKFVETELRVFKASFKSTVEGNNKKNCQNAKQLKTGISYKNGISPSMIVCFPADRPHNKNLLSL